MKINRLELIDILKRRVQVAEQDRQRRYDKAVEDYHRAGRDYFSRTKDAWVDFADTITRTVDRGKTITRNDIPPAISSRFNILDLFDQRPPTEPTPTEQEQQLLTLVEVLKQTSDEEVSTYSLEKMGFALGRVLK